MECLRERSRPRSNRTMRPCAHGLACAGTWYGIGHASGTSPRYGPFKLLLSGDNTFFTGTWGEGDDEDGSGGSSPWRASRLSFTRPADEVCWFGAPDYGGE